MHKMKILVAFYTLLLIPSVTKSQWIEGTVPYTGTAFLSLATMGNNLIAVCGGEVFRSTDSGQTWLDANNGIEYTSDATTLMSFEDGIFVGTIYNAFILYSSDMGQSWQVRHKGFIGEGVNQFIAFGDTIIVSGGSGLYRSTDTGLLWNPIDTIPPYLVVTQAVRTLAYSGGYVFAGCDAGGVYRSTNSGDTWQQVLPLPNDTSVYCMAAMGHYIFAGVGGILSSFTGYLYRSSDYGQTWSVTNNGLPYNERPGTFFVMDSLLFVGFSSGGSVYCSRDSGTTWSLITDSNAAIKGNAFAAGMGNLFVAGGDLWYRPLSSLFSSSAVTFASTSSMKIYPNPTTNILYSNKSLDDPIQIYDPLGRQYPIIKSLNSLNVSNLPSGVYYLFDGSGIHAKFIKE